MTELSLRCASIYALEYQRDLSGMWKWEAVTGIASERSFFVGTSSTYCDWWWVPGDTEEKLQNLRICREGGAAASDAREFHCHVFPEQWKSVHLLEQLIQLAPKIHSWSPDRCAVHCCPHTQRTNYLSSVLNTVFMLQSLGNCSMSWCCDAEHRTDNRAVHWATQHAHSETNGTQWRRWIYQKGECMEKCSSDEKHLEQLVRGRGTSAEAEKKKRICRPLI